MNGLSIGAGGAACLGEGRSTTREILFERLRSGWHAYAGLASLIGCPTLLISFFAIHYGLPLLVGVKAIAALYVLCVVPGYFIQVRVLGIRATLPFETLASSLLLGALLTPFLWYALCCAGLSAVFYPGMVLLAAAVPVRYGWHRRIGVRMKGLVTPADAPVLWLAIILAILWSWRLVPFETIREGQVTILQHVDHLVHTTLVAELSRGIPAEAIPFIAGPTKWAYHYMPDVWCDMIRRMVGTDARDAYFFLALPLRYVFLTLGCYLALLRRFGRVGALAGAACMLMVVGYPYSWILLTNWLLSFLHESYPTPFGLCGFFLILYYASMLDRGHLRGTLMLTAVLSALLLWHKANFALVVVPAVAIFSAVVLIRAHDVRWLFACLAAQGLIVGVHQLSMWGADFGTTFVMAPGAFLNDLWCKLSLPGEMPSHAVDVFRRTVNGFPRILRWPVVFVTCMAHTFHVGFIIGVYAVVRCGFGRRRPRLEHFDLLVLLVLLLCFVGFVIFPVQKGMVLNVSFHLWALVYAILFGLLGPVLCDLMRRLATCKRRAFIAGTALLALAFAGNAYALGRKVFGPLPYHCDVMDVDLYRCFRYIESSTPRDAVVMQPRFLEGWMGAAGITQRRTVLDGARIWRPVYDDTALMLADLQAFYGGGIAPRCARDIVDRYGADYVVAEAGLPDSSGYDSFLTEVFRSGGMVVFQVKPLGDGTAVAGGQGP
ncbi:MAG: hypothetical protein JXQ73_25700 [Phycisphaerae bacterium]|nr:hypothetical protein [Phycisphaerae bacterium]